MIFWTAVPLHAMPPGLMSWTTLEDKALVQNRKSHISQETSLLARASLRALLFLVTHRINWTLQANSVGKPILLSLEGSPAPFISLSHTKDMVACAVSEKHPIGVDIEHQRERCFSDIAAYAFGPNEQAYVQQQGIKAFYKIWTLREAHAKKEGRGLLAEMNGQDAFADYTKEDCWTEQKHNLFHTEIKPNHCLAIATQDEEPWGIHQVLFVDLSNVPALQL